MNIDKILKPNKILLQLFLVSLLIAIVLFVIETQIQNVEQLRTIDSLEIMVIIFTIIFSYIYFSACIKTKKTLKKYGKEELEQELLNSKVIEFEDTARTWGMDYKYRIYLTNKYLISTKFGLFVIKYQDIYWMYTRNKRVSYWRTYTKLVLRDKSKKKHYLGQSNTDFDKEIFQKIMKRVEGRNKKMLITYTKQNEEAFKKLKKEKF